MSCYVDFCSFYFFLIQTQLRQKNNLYCLRKINYKLAANKSIYKNQSFRGMQINQPDFLIFLVFSFIFSITIYINKVRPVLFVFKNKTFSPTCYFLNRENNRENLSNNRENQKNNKKSSSLLFSKRGLNHCVILFPGKIKR